MKSRFFVLSIVLHMTVFVGFSKISDNSLKKGESSPNINVNLTMSAPGNATQTMAKMTTKKEKILDKKTKPIKKKIKPKKQVVQKKKEIIKTEPKIVQSKKTKPEKIMKPVDPNQIKGDKNIEKNNSEVEVVQNNPSSDAVLGDQENDKNLIKMENGQYALKNQKISGIHIVIIKKIPPTYPNLARKMGYKKKTFVKVKFLVDEKGRVRNITFYTKSKYDFEGEVEEALKKWVFEPIIYHGKPMPTYFSKVFHFVYKS